MAKTVFLNNHAQIVLGYEVETRVASASLIYDGGGHPIGTKVYPEEMGAIAVNMLLAIEGAGQFTVTAVGSDAGGGYFTYTPQAVPAEGAAIRTPWNASGTLLVTRAHNSITLSYRSPAEHDLYFGTQRTSDSGSITAVLDGELLGTFDLFNGSTVLSEVLLKAKVGAGEHTLIVQAQIAPPDIFVYFHKIELVEHIVETGGFYYFLGPAGTLEDATQNFIGDWGDVGTYAFATAPGASVFFYPQLEAGGAVKMRVQKTPDSGIISLYKDGVFVTNIDLYADPAQALVDVPLLASPPADAGQCELEVRVTGTKNALAAGTFFYFRGSVVLASRTDAQALELTANYLERLARARGDGSFPDAYDSTRINFDANSLYGCMGLLAAYRAIGGTQYLEAVRDFLIWFASMQVNAPGILFDDGHWKIGYQVNPEAPPTYIPAIAPYDAQGISEIRWVDAVQCLPAFVLWWYWKLSGDDATRDALLPVFKKGVDGFIRNNYDAETGFCYSSWQNKTAPTIFLYHDAVRRCEAGGGIVEQHNDSEEGFFTYSPQTTWSSYAAAGALGADEHYTLASGSYVEFSLALDAGDSVRWLTQTAWDAGIAEVLVSSDGVNFAPAGTVDCYSPASLLQREFLIYTASTGGTLHFRIRHSGTINAAGAATPGWHRVSARYSAGQVDIALGLAALWQMTKLPRYAHLCTRITRRFAAGYWAAPLSRWLIALAGPPPGAPDSFWYPFTHGYAPFGFATGTGSRFFQLPALLTAGLQALEAYQDAEGGFQPPGYSEPEHIFSAFYLLGQNQLANPTDTGKYEMAKEFIKSGQYLLTLGGEQVAGIVFSKRYPYLYSNVAGFACLALAESVTAGAGKNPMTETIQLNKPVIYVRP